MIVPLKMIIYLIESNFSIQILSLGGLVVGDMHYPLCTELIQQMLVFWKLCMQNKVDPFLMHHNEVNEDAVIIHVATNLK